MKKSDIAVVVLIAGIATILAFVLGNVFMGDPNEEKVTVQYMEVIASDIAQPDEELFNDLAINPTVETYVGQCGSDETWDDVVNRCVSNSLVDEEGGDDSDDDTDGTDADGTEGNDINTPTLPGE